MSWRARVGIGAASAGAVLLLLAGCGGGAAPSALPVDGPAPTGAPTGPASSPGLDGPVLAGYLAYWDAVIHAHRTANPADPELGRHTGGAELAKVRGVVARNRQQRISVRGTVTHAPAVAAVTGAAAVVNDCYDVSRWNPVDVRTGKAIDAVETGGTGRYRGQFGLRQGTGGWYVVSSKTLGAC